MPEIGRFISEDPWQGTIAEPTTMNPYPYVQNNPIKYVDPLGLRHMVQDGRSAGVALPSTSAKDPLNKAREEVVQKQVNNVSGWNCNIVNDGISEADYATIGVASTISLAPPSSTVIELPSALSNPITAAVAIGLIILFKPEYAGETEEDLKAYFDSLEKAEDNKGENNKEDEKSQTPKVDRPFKEKLKDINENSQNWEKTKETVIDSTKKGNRGGKSIESEYKNKETGEVIYKHTLTDTNEKTIEKPHYRPYPKQ